MYTERHVSAPVTVINGMIVYLADAIGGLCFIAGIFMLLGCVYHWMERRKTPGSIPMTKIFSLFAIGAALMCIQYLPMHRV